MSNYASEIGRKGRTVGLFLTMASAVVSEIAANSGFDWLVFDAEHGPYEPSTLLPLLQAVAPYPCEPIVRLPSDCPVLIKRYLDLGLRTILVPMVESAEQAALIVSATRYPPLGMRGVGSGIARASRWGKNREYLAGADGGITVLLQVESLAGLAALPSILGVEGVDGVFVGPADLAASMGLLGNSGHPDVQEKCHTAIRAIVEAGKVAGFFATTIEGAEQAFSLGASFVAVGADCSIFARNAEALAAHFSDRNS